MPANSSQLAQLVESAWQICFFLSELFAAAIRLDDVSSPLLSCLVFEARHGQLQSAHAVQSESEVQGLADLLVKEAVRFAMVRHSHFDFFF